MNIPINIEWGKGGVIPPWPIGGGVIPSLRIRP